MKKTTRQSIKKALTKEPSLKKHSLKKQQNQQYIGKDGIIEAKISDKKSNIKKPSLRVKSIKNKIVKSPLFKDKKQDTKTIISKTIEQKNIEKNPSKNFEKNSIEKSIENSGKNSNKNPQKKSHQTSYHLKDLIGDNKDKMRIAKYIAHSGFCSRREAEDMILEGRVKVNGEIITSPAVIITDQAVKIDNKLINKKDNIDLWLFHKPKQVITSNKDDKGRTTIFELLAKKLPKNAPRVITIGRLDYNTEGLILLTNNGDFARYLELPKNNFTRKYRVRVFGKLDYDRLERLAKGITIDSVRYSSIKVKIDIEKEYNSWLEVEICEGKNREIRKVMEHLGLQVTRLIRTQFGPFMLGSLKAGELQKVSKLALKNYS